jgi:hypothetical protein
MGPPAARNAAQRRTAPRARTTRRRDRRERELLARWRALFERQARRVA